MSYSNDFYDSAPKPKKQMISSRFPQPRDTSYDSPQKNNKTKSALQSSSKKKPAVPTFHSKKHLMMINIDYHSSLHEFKVYPGETARDLLSKITIRLKLNKKAGEQMKQEVLQQLGQVRTRLQRKLDDKQGMNKDTPQDTPQELPVVAVINIEILDRHCELVVREGDDPWQVAGRFVEEQGLSGQAVPVIREKILEVVGR